VPRWLAAAQGVLCSYREAARTLSPIPGPGRLGWSSSFRPPGHEHYQKELALLVSKATGSLDEAIKELRARYDIEQITPQVLPRPH